MIELSQDGFKWVLVGVIFLLLVCMLSNPLIAEQYPAIWVIWTSWLTFSSYIVQNLYVRDHGSLRSGIRDKENAFFSKDIDRGFICNAVWIFQVLYIHVLILNIKSGSPESWICSWFLSLLGVNMSLSIIYLTSIKGAGILERNRGEHMNGLWMDHKLLKDWLYRKRKQVRCLQGLKEKTSIEQHNIKTDLLYYDDAPKNNFTLHQLSVFLMGFAFKRTKISSKVYC